MSEATTSALFSSSVFRPITLKNRINLTLIVITIGLVFWIGDALFDSQFFQDDTFFNELFMPSARELAMRLVLVFGIALFTYFYLSLRYAGQQLEVFFTIIESAADSVLLRTPEGQILYANNMASKKLGYTREEFSEMNLKDIDPAIQDSELVDSAKTLRAKKIFRGERTHRTKMGEMIPVEFVGSYLKVGGREYVLSIVRDVSERRKYEEALKRSQKSLLEAQRIAKMGSYVWDLKTGGAEFSDELYPLYGLEVGDPEFTLAKTFELVHPDDRPTLKKTIEDDLRNKKPHLSEHRIIWPNGTVRWLYCQGELVLDGAGDPLRMIGTIRDITEQKKAEEELSFTQFSVDHIGDSVFWMNQEGKFLYANSFACRNLGYTREELYTMYIPDINPTFGAVDWSRHWENIKNKKVHRFETVNKRQNGEIFPVEVTANYISFGAKEIICSFVREISERKKTEKAIFESKDRLRAIIEAEPECVKQLDADGCLLEMNAAGLKMIEADSLEQVKGGSVYPIVCEPYRDAFIALTHQVFQGKTGSLEFQIMGLKGGMRWLETQAAPLYDHQDPTKISALLAVTRDITDRKMAEVERAELLEKEKFARLSAEKANRVKDEFLATLSHELRTPLTTILAWSQLLRMGKLDSEKTKHGIEVLEQSAKAQGQLIDDLLDLSRIQAGKLSLTIQEVDPSWVVATAIDSTRSLAVSKKIVIESQINPSVNQIFADPTRLQQILWNLVTNAIKFSPQGGRVWITVDRVSNHLGEQIRIQVRDIGKGISSDFIAVIFNRFTQADSTSTRAYGGLGLGLAIVKKLIEMHQGTVDVSSPGEGQGSTFTVLLPAKPSGKVRAIKDQVKTEVTLSGLRVLMVDDEPSAREVFAVMLQSFGAEVKVVGSAQAALDAIEEFNPDVLVSDIAMPGEDGYSLIGKIRALKSGLARIPALALTAYCGPEDVQRIHLAGFNSDIAKPVDANALARKILKLAGRV